MDARMKIPPALRVKNDFDLNSVSYSLWGLSSSSSFLDRDLPFVSPTSFHRQRVPRLPSVVTTRLSFRDSTFYSTYL